jgi:hypothetical protein
MAGTGIDITTLIPQAIQTANQFTNTENQVADTVNQGNDITNQIQQATQDASNAAQVKTSIEVSEVARQEAARKAIAARLGTDPSQSGWVIGKAMDDIQSANAQLADASERIRQKQSANILTDPLNWFLGKLTINQDIADYNAAARQKDNAEETARQAESFTQAAFQTSNALSSTATEAYSNALQILGANQYRIAGLNAAMQGVRWNMEGIMHITELSKERLGVLFSANTAVNQERQFNLESQRIQLATQEFALHKAQFSEKQDEDSFIAQRIRDGYFVMTGKQMDPVSTKNALLLYRNKEPNTVAMFESGLQTMMAGNKPVINLSPYKASETFATGKVSNLSPAMQQVGEQLVTWRRKFEGDPSIQTNPNYAFDPKDKASKEIAFNKYVQDQKALETGNTQVGSIFAPMPLDKVAAVNKNIAAMPVWNNVIKPAAATGVNINDPNLLFGVISNAMREGKLSYADALDLPVIYAAGVEMNNQTRNLMAFGVSPVKTYNAAISVPNSIGKTTVNLTDQKAFATILNKVQAMNAAKNYVDSQSPFPIR